MKNKPRFYGFLITGFVLLFTLPMLKPKKGIDPLLFNARNIDSIEISKDDTIITLTAPNDILSVSKQLQKSNEIDIDGIKGNTGFIDLFFFTNPHKKVHSVRIAYNYSHGIVITNEDQDKYYRNDSLNTLITTYLRK